MRHLLLICVVLFAQPLWADDEAKVPMIVVTSPKETVAGKLVKFDASKSTVDSMEWRLMDGPQDDFSVDTDGRHATFGTPTPGVYFVAIAGSTLVDGKAVATIAIVKVTLIADPKQPPTTPPVVPPANPPGTPPVTPPTTPPANDLSNWVRAMARATVTDDPKREQTAKALAVTYRTWAASRGAGSDTAQRFVLGSNRLVDILLTQVGKLTMWKNFRDALDEELASRGLKTVDQHIAAWEEIAKGLEAVQ